jgi:hypothetical protein
MRNKSVIPLTILEEGFMKRTLSVLVAMLLVIAVVGPAAAFFERGKLVQVIYKDMEQEVLTDLLNTQTYDWSTPGTYNLTAPGTFSTSQFASLGTPDPGDWASLSAAFFGHTSSGQAWFATTRTTAPEIRTSSLLSFLSGTNTVQVAAGGFGTQTAIRNYDEQAYDYALNSRSTTPGQFGGYNKNFADGEILLTDLASQNFLSMYLYKFNVNNLQINPVDPSNGVPYFGELRLFADGHTEVVIPSASSAVPIPAAVWLLASGMIGLVGIRRRRDS